MDYFAPKLSPQELQAISAIGLAHMGDAVYELLVRTWLCVHGKATGKELHRATVALVCAPEQARRHSAGMPAGMAVPPGRQGPDRGVVQRDDGGGWICLLTRSVCRASWRS